MTPAPRRAMNAMSPATPMTRLASTTGLPQPRDGPSIRPKTSAPRPIVSKTAPMMSSCPASSSRLSGTPSRATATTMTANGRLIKNTQRQEAFSTSHPPRTGPNAAVIAVNPDQVPIARPRSVSSLKAALMMARLAGVSSAAATPWAARATISISMFGESPHQTEVAAKSTVPITKIRFLPKRSPSTPPTRSNAARKRA